MIRDIYIMRVNGAWGGYMPRKKCSLIFNADKGVELVEFVQGLRAEYPHHRLRCVINAGIAEKIKEQQQILRRFNNGRD